MHKTLLSDKTLLMWVKEQLLPGNTEYLKVHSSFTTPL